MRRKSLGACALALAVCFPGARATTATPTYAIAQRIAGPGTDWDYVSVDAAARRLYVAQVGGVTVVDLKSNQLTSQYVKGGMTHGVLPLAGGLAAVTDSGMVTASDHGHGTITLFDAATGKVRASLPVPKGPNVSGYREPNGLTFEPKSGLVVVNNAESGELVLVNPVTPSIVGTIPIGGNLEFMVADGKGNFFLNVASANEIAVVDVMSRHVTKRYPLQGCEGPTGLSYDALDNLLISVCGNGVAKFVDAASGRQVASVAIGKGADASIFDAQRRLAFAPSGEAGTLSIIAVHSSSDIALAQTLSTQVGSRTGALDPQTGWVYLPAAQFSPPTAEMPFPSAIRGTFNILVVAPQ